MAQDYPLQSNVFKMERTNFSSVSAMLVVGSILGSNAIGQLVARIEGKNLWNMERDGSNDDI